MFTKRIWWLVLAAALLPLSASATSVTLNVTDAGSQAWANGTWSVFVVPPGGYPAQPNLTQSGSLDGSGAATGITMTATASLAPGGTVWRVSVCPNASSQCYVTTQTIVGGSQTLTLTPPAISISLQNIPNVLAYADSEIQSPTSGMLYFNTTDSRLHYYNGSVWAALAVGGGGTIGGTIAATQIAFGSGVNTITGNADLTTNGAGNVAVGVDNTAAGTITLANGSAAAHTILSSGATTTNTIKGFTVAPVTGDLVSCTVAATTCTLTDSGVLAANTVTTTGSPASGNLTGFSGATTISTVGNPAWQFGQDAASDLDCWGSTGCAISLFTVPGGTGAQSVLTPNSLVMGAATGTDYTISVSSSLLNLGSTAVTASSTGVVTANSFASSSNGTDSGYVSLIGNTANFAVTANTAGFMGPNLATFTGYALQLPSTGPTNSLPLLSCATPSSSVSACTFVANGGGTVTSIATTSPITGGTITTTGTIACATCVTSASSLTNNAVVLGGGSQASKTATFLTTDGAATLTVGVAGGGNGVLALAGTTSGTATFTAPGTAGTNTNPVVSSNNLQLPAGTNTNPSLNNGNNGGLFFPTANLVELVGGGNHVLRVGGTFVDLASGAPMQWDSSSNYSGSADTGLSRGAAGLVDLGSGAAASTAGYMKSTIQTVTTAADVTCGTGGTISDCTTAHTITGLTFTLPLVSQNWSIDCDGVVGQATGDAANQWLIQTATNGATSTTASYMMATAATASAYGAATDVASTTTAFQITPNWTLGGTATKMPWHIHATITGASASGTVVNIQVINPTNADLLTIYEGATCTAK